MEKLDFDQLVAGNRRSLAKAITLVESTLPEDAAASQEILEKVIPISGKSIRLGISGVPGVGKSTFIEALGLELVERGHKVAVLAVDPSSPQTGGSILGDKTRMIELSSHPSAFIRPSPTAGVLGGVARSTRETILLCEAAGYDRILIETVGVGQSEFEVASMTDLFILLALTGAGDGLQGIKRGILEITDMLIINKADGDNRPRAKVAAKEYEAALHLLHPRKPVPVLLTSAIEKMGIDEVIEQIEKEVEDRQENGIFDQKRQQQRSEAFKHLIETELIQRFWDNDSHKQRFKELSEHLREGKTTISRAIQEIIKDRSSSAQQTR